MVRSNVVLEMLHFGSLFPDGLVLAGVFVCCLVVCEFRFPSPLMSLLCEDERLCIPFARKLAILAAYLSWIGASSVDGDAAWSGEGIDTADGEGVMIDERQRI